MTIDLPILVCAACSPVRSGDLSEYSVPGYSYLARTASNCALVSYIPRTWESLDSVHH